MKKRIVSALLAAVLCVGLLAACGSKDNKNEETTAVETTTAAAKEKAVSLVKGVKFDVPKDWSSLEAEKSETALFKTADGVNITIVNGELEEKEQQGLDTLIKIFNNPSVSEEMAKQTGSAKISVDGKEGFRTSVLNGEIHIATVFVKNGENIFLIRAAGTAATKELTDKQITELLNTVKFE